MTNSEAIREIENIAVDLTGTLAGLSENPSAAKILERKIEAINAAQAALRAQAEKNDPLTLEEMQRLHLPRKIQAATAEKTAAVLLSGGRDSLLAACLVIEQGFSIIPIICNNGHMEGIDRAQLTVANLKERYGGNRVEDLMQCNTGMTLHSYMLSLWYKKPGELYLQYPDLEMCQAHCLACKAAMYIHIISFCRAKGINYVVDGMRETQGFFVDLPEMRERFGLLCSQNEIELITPVYELLSDLRRKRMLCDRGMPTKTLEPQCFLGCPLAGALSYKERESLSAFFDNELVQFARRDIQELIRSKAI